MADFIRVGDYWINLALVTHVITNVIDDEGTREARVFCIGDEYTDPTFELTGDEAEEFLKALRARSKRSK